MEDLAICVHPFGEHLPQQQILTPTTTELAVLMRKFLLFSALALVFSTSLVVAQPPQPAAVASESIGPGSIVQVAMERTELKAGKSVVAVLTKGVRFEVLSVRDPWLEGKIAVNGVMRTGWVLRSQIAVVPANGKPADEKPAEAQESYKPQITGVIGSPAATTTISGKQLPAPRRNSLA